jgi:hypothetical protein
MGTRTRTRGSNRGNSSLITQQLIISNPITNN